MDFEAVALASTPLSRNGCVSNMRGWCLAGLALQGVIITTQRPSVHIRLG
jgi:hypothetical protein